MAAEILIGDIVQGTARTISVSYRGTAPANASSLSYRLGFSQTEGGSDLLAVNFGSANYSNGVWTITLSRAQTRLLPVGTVYLCFWETGTPQALNAYKLTVKKQPGEPA